MYVYVFGILVANINKVTDDQFVQYHIKSPQCVDKFTCLNLFQWLSELRTKRKNVDIQKRLVVVGVW